MKAASHILEYKEAQRLQQRPNQPQIRFYKENSSFTQRNSSNHNIKEENFKQQQVNSEKRNLSPNKIKKANIIEQKHTNSQTQNEAQFIRLIYVSCLLVCLISLVFGLYKHEGHLLDMVEVK